MPRGSNVIVAVAAFAAAVFVSPAAAECTCRALGRNFELGQSVCMATPGGPRLATCGMVLNNTSWRISGTPCVTSMNAAPLRADMGAPVPKPHQGG